MSLHVCHIHGMYMYMMCTYIHVQNHTYMYVAYSSIHAHVSITQYGSTVYIGMAMGVSAL